MGFAENLNKLCASAGEKAEMVVRRTALDLQSQMIERSPVGTGRFRGNWQVGIGAMNTDTGSGEDKIGSSAIGRAKTVLDGWKPGQTIILSNSLPYARRLEDGWSQQAPSGMVKLTIQAYGDALQKAVESMR